MQTLPESEFLHVGDYAEKAYLAYSLSVIKGRAIPDSQDGLKPVQRRILYAMRELRLAHTAPHKKSARVVGDVIGKYHPHGDTAVYDTMVRMAQDFSLRYPLIDGQGNFGSLDGDSPAAMRYTESRLSIYADLLLDEVDRGTVDFRDNYDGHDVEPVLLPARLPFNLLNGQSGIAVGLAMDSVPHNLVEVGRAAEALYADPSLSVAQLMKYIPGPDFPLGGQVIASRAELREVYESGSGSVPVQARWQVEKLAGGDWQVVIYELPPGVSSEQILGEIEALSNPQPKKGSKTLTAEQQGAKQALLALVGGVRNGAGSDTTRIRVVIEPRSRRVDPELLMAHLFNVTSLRTRAKVNFTFIGPDGAPGQYSLKELLQHWCDFRETTVRRRTAHRLGEVEHRLLLLEGRRAILVDIDEAIAIIRDSEDAAEARTRLMARFGLNEIQADDVLALRLRQLTRLDALALESEMAKLQEEAAGLRVLLESREALIGQIKEEIRADVAKYGDDRRTLIKAEEIAETPSVAQLTDEPVTVILSKRGWVRQRSGHNLDLSGLAFKPGDEALCVVETRTAWPVVVLDTHGRTYSLPHSGIPGGRSDGAPVSSMADLGNGGELVALLSAPADQRYLLAGAGGYGFVVDMANLVANKRAGKAVLTLKEGERPLPPLTLRDETLVAVLSSAGNLLVFDLSDIKMLPKGKGVKLQGLKPGESLAWIGLGQTAIELPSTRKRPIALDAEGVEQYRRNRGARGQRAPKGVK